MSRVNSEVRHRIGRTRHIAKPYVCYIFAHAGTLPTVSSAERENVLHIDEIMIKNV